MRWYAGVGAHALTMHQASNSVFCPQICKVGCFLFTSGGVSLRGIASSDICHLRCAVSVTAVASLADSVLLKPIGENKNTHPPLADKILERTRRGRRSPPVKGTTKPSWRWLNVTRSCHRVFTPPILHACASVVDGRSPLLKGYLTWKAWTLLWKSPRSPLSQSAQECPNEYNHTNPSLNASVRTATVKPSISWTRSLCVCAPWRVRGGYWCGRAATRRIQSALPL